MTQGEPHGGELPGGEDQCSAGPDALSSVIDWLDTGGLGDGDDVNLGCGVGGAGAAAVLQLEARSGGAGSPRKPPSVMREQCGPGAAMAKAAGGASLCCRSLPHAAACGTFRDRPEDVTGFVPRRLTAEKEAMEWDLRLQRTGATGRLVEYEGDEKPQEDFSLRGLAGQRVVVAAVVMGGKAYSSGVKAGDMLVSIDGRKDFVGRSADAVFSSLTPPVMVVFMGFVGRLQSEVRLRVDFGDCVLPSRQPVVLSGVGTRVRMVSEVVFQPSLRRSVLTAARRVSSPRDVADALADAELEDADAADSRPHDHEQRFIV